MYCYEFNCSTPCEISVIDRGSQAIWKFSLENTKTFLVHFVRDAIFDPFSNHHLAAAHKIVHYVFQSGFESVQVYQIEVNVVLSRYLEPVSVLNVVNGPSDFDRMDKLPLQLLCHKVNFFQEKLDFIRGLNHKTLIVN